MTPRHLNCHCCYQLGIAELRWDKYGRPWVMCGACGARTFTRSPNALRGIYMTSRMVEAVCQRVQSDPVECDRREREAEAFVREVRAEREMLVRETVDRSEGADHVQAVQPAAAGK